MSDNQLPKPYPRNAPGCFFVEDGRCIECRAPEAEAPELMTHDVSGHCYFMKQPSTQPEIEQAVEAVHVSCCGAVQYLGDDPVVLEEFVASDNYYEKFIGHKFFVVKQVERDGKILTWVQRQ